MNNSKLSKRLIISCFTSMSMLAFILVSCETEQLEPQSITKEAIDLSKKGNRPDRIDICHYDEDTQGWMQITVSERAWEDHSLHGDQWLDRDGDGFTAANECGIGSMDDCDDTDASINPESGCDPKIFAIAYSNLNGEPGFQENSADVLISKLVDFNNDNLINAGDKVITDRYPTNCEASSFGAFGIKEHLVHLSGLGEYFISVVTADLTYFAWSISPGGGSAYSEIDETLPNVTFSFFEDSIGDGWSSRDVVIIDMASPSKPSENLQFVNCDNNADNDFLDVDLFLD